MNNDYQAQLAARDDTNQKIAEIEVQWREINHKYQRLCRVRDTLNDFLQDEGIEQPTGDSGEESPLGKSGLTLADDKNQSSDKMAKSDVHGNEPSVSAEKQDHSIPAASALFQTPPTRSIKNNGNSLIDAIVSEIELPKPVLEKQRFNGKNTKPQIKPEPQTEMLPSIRSEAELNSVSEATAKPFRKGQGETMNGLLIRYFDVFGEFQRATEITSGLLAGGYETSSPALEDSIRSFLRQSAGEDGLFKKIEVIKSNDKRRIVLWGRRHWRADIEGKRILED